MRAAVATGFEGVDDIAVRERPDPVPDSGEAVVDVEAASLNHRDVWPFKGHDDVAPTEAVPLGSDLAGTVAETGSGVSAFQPGDRVLLCPNETCGSCRYCRHGPENLCATYGIYDGAFAEQALVDADRLLELPETVSAADAASLPIAYMTAYRMLEIAGTEPGDRVLIPGATGGVGIAAAQLAGAMGAEVVGTSRSPEKLAAVADRWLHDSFVVVDAGELRDALDGVEPIDVTINHLGGEFTPAGAAVLRRNGTMVVCGRTAGGTAEIDVRSLYWDHKRIVGSTMGTQADLQRVLDLHARDAYQPLIAESAPLDRVNDLFRRLESGDHVGKLVLRPQA